MRVIRLFETYKSQIELEKLSIEIIDILWNKISKTKENASVKLSEVSDSRYNELSSFISAFKELTIIISDDDKFMKKNVEGFYINDDIDSINYKYIYMYVSNKSLNSYINDNKYTLFQDRYTEILIHELQHAYDDYRSKGKFSNIKIDKKELDDVLTKYKVYYNIPYEVSAFISAYIYDTSFYQWDLEKSWESGEDKYTIIPFDEVYKKFLNNIKFTWFDKHLSDENRKKTIRKFVKFYNDEKENGLILSYIKQRETHLS